MNKSAFPMMKCGHAGQATTGNNQPCCPVCFGSSKHQDSITVDPNPSPLKGRKAQCHYCKKTTDSNPDLAYFGSYPNREFDDYYCGCMGWN